MGVTLPAFQVLIDEHRDDVYRFLRASVGTHDADDCFQETFIAALRAYPRLRADSNLRGWLFTIAHHKALDSHRARNRHAVPVEVLPETVGEPLLNGGEPELWKAVGALPVAATSRGLIRIAYNANETAEIALEELARRVSPRVLEAPAALDDIRRELDEYFEGERTGFDIPIDWRLHDGFGRRVLRA